MTIKITFTNNAVKYFHTNRNKNSSIIGTISSIGEDSTIKKITILNKKEAANAVKRTIYKELRKEYTNDISMMVEIKDTFVSVYLPKRSENDNNFFVCHAIGTNDILDINLMYKISIAVDYFKTKIQDYINSNKIK